MSPSILTIADPVETFNPPVETTSYILFEAQQNKWAVWMTTLPELMFGEKKFEVITRLVKIENTPNGFVYQTIKEKTVNLKNFNVVFLRKDPPVDEAFTQHLIMLNQFEVTCKGKGPFFINSPKGVLESNEKIFPMMIPGLSPPTLVTSSVDAFSGFLKKHKKIVMKPLNLSGGRGVELLVSSQKNATTLFKKASLEGKQYLMLQRFIPQAIQGDKRILVLDGKILGSFLRVPAKGDFRGNIHSGAKLAPCQPTPSDKKLVTRLTPYLKARGLYFVGIDLLGNYVTEINSTSPMGVNEINQVENSQTEKIIVKWMTKKVL